MTEQSNYFKTFCKISRAFGSTLELHALLQLVVENATSTMKAKAACLFMADKNEGLSVPVVQYGLSQDYLHAQPRAMEAAVTELLENGGHLYFQNAVTDARSSNPEAKAAEGIVSILVVPMMIRRQAIGVLALYTAEERRFSADEVEFVSALAEQGAMAIENARLMQRLRMNTQLFHDMAVNMNSTLDIQKILNILSADVAEIFEVMGISIHLLDSQCQTLRRVVSYGLSENCLAQEEAVQACDDPRLPREVQRIQDIAQIKEPALREALRAEGIVSMLVVPVHARDDVIGVMKLYSRTARDFSEMDIMLATAIAHQGGLAIQNASMYLTLQEDKRSLEQDIWSHRTWF